mgnify:CR=1 FL=1
MCVIVICVVALVMVGLFLLGIGFHLRGIHHSGVARLGYDFLIYIVWVSRCVVRNKRVRSYVTLESFM